MMVGLKKEYSYESFLKPGLMFLLVFLIGLPAFSAGEEKTEKKGEGLSFMTIGTGGQTGVYFAVGNALCRLVNRASAQNTNQNKKNSVKCTAPSTGGSIYNVNALRTGELDFGVVQSDWQYHAVHGTSKFEKAGPFKELRSLFSVHPEPFTVVARKDSGIKTFADLKGKRVNVGNPGSGQRGTIEVLMKAFGWKMEDFKLASELKASEQSAALCDNKVDAIVYAVGHPNGAIKEATTSCDSVLVSVTGAPVDKLIKENEFYAPAKIPGGMYQGNDADTPTFGVRATFVTTSQVSDDMVKHLLEALYGVDQKNHNFDTFKKLHPAFSNLTADKDRLEGNSAPLHKAAAEFYKEKGWR